MHESYRTPLPPLDTAGYLALWRALFEIPVTVGAIPADPCMWCGAEDRPARARVHGDPSPEALTLAWADCCWSCVPEAVARALRDVRDDSRRGVRLEVSSWAG
jgi:hypothetical protein